MDSVHDCSKGIAELAPTHHLHRGITCFDIVEVYLPEWTVRQMGFVQAIPSFYETSQGYTTGTRYLLRDLCFSGCVLGGME